MSTFTISTPIQLEAVGNVPFVITETADAIVAPADNVVALYVYIDDAQDFRHGEIYRGWEFCYRGWKNNAYDPFDGVGPNDVLFCTPLDAPYPEYRKITTDFTIDSVIVSGDIGFGISSTLDLVGQNTIQAKNAFNALRDYYLETYGKK